MAINNPFYIVDRDLNKIAQIDNYTALSYCIKSYDFNEFQMKIPQDSTDGQKIIGLLDQEFYMVNINNPEETAYITVKGKKLGSKEREIILTGYGPKYRFFKKRTILDGILVGDIIKSRTFEDVEADKIALDLINENCINASDANRNFPNLQIPSLSAVKKLLSRNYANEELFEELKKLMIDGEFTVRVIPDLATKKWNISIGLGVDRTGTGISKVVFSEGSKNLNSNELIVDDSQFQNVVVAFSESSGDGKITEVGDLVASGFDRYETPLFSNELDDNKIIDDANARLAETQSVLTVNAQAVSIGSNYVFKRDYDLYDKVIYKDNDTEIRSEERIINITRVYEKNKEPETVLDFGFTKTNTKEQNRDITNRLKIIERKLVGGAGVVDVNIVGQELVVRTEDERNKIKPIAISKMSSLAFEGDTTGGGAINTYDVTVAIGDIGNFTVGAFVTIFNVADNRFYQGKVVAINSNIITLDTLIDFTYSAGSVITSGSTNIAVDGSGGARPVIFGLRNTAERIPTTIDITRIIFTFNLTDNGKFDEFGNLPALEYGLACRRTDTIITNYWNVKTNKEIASLLYDFQLIDAVNFGQGGAGSFARLTFEKIGSAVRLEPDDDFQILVQDDLSNIPLFEITVEGYLVFPE